MNCLDAETLAAWTEGGLKGAALEDVQAHVAGCDRCQMLLGAMGRTRAAVSPPIHERAPRRWLAWAVPLAAAAAAVAVWVAIPQQRGASVVPPPATPAQNERAAAPFGPAEPPPAVAAPRPAVRPQASAQSPLAAERLQKQEARAEVAQGAPAGAEPSAPAGAEPSPPAAIELSPPQPVEISRDARSRIAAPKAIAALSAPGIEVLCGPRWTSPPADVVGQLTAGSSPSPNVCWVVGRGGVIRRSTNGQTWQAIRFQEMTDLSGVQAADARSATVTASDGRSFRTSDGGVTWMPQ